MAGKEIGEPLLMSTYSLLQPTTTVEDIMGGPKEAESKSNPKEGKKKNRVKQVFSFLKKYN